MPYPMVRIAFNRTEQKARGHLRFQDTAEAAEVFVALVVGDQQVRRLLGSLPEPKSSQVAARAERAVKAFLALSTAG